MFPSSTYAQRRRTLMHADQPASGLVLLLGNRPSPMNARGNPHPFRQDSTFLYYTGLDVPGLDAVMDLDAGTTCLYGTDPTIDDVIWKGDQPSLQDHADRADISKTASSSSLADDLTSALDAEREIHILPPYREAHYRRLSALLNLDRDQADAAASPPLLDTVIAQRSVKSDAEVEQIEQAVETTVQMHQAAFEHASPGTPERHIAGRLSGIAAAEGRGLAFQSTCSVYGEVLHNHDYSHRLKDGDLLLIDTGGTSPLHYAGDLTRVVPVGGDLSPRQRALYEAVLDAQQQAIDALAPGVPFRKVHRRACRVLTTHLIEMGLMSGPADAAVRAGAHALFFPHGLGHMLGLDVHDMEALGETRVGYADDQKRSDQFGLHALRLARPLKPGFVVTVEPGCYFIPALIQQWLEEKRHVDFINYDAVKDFESFGGIRIEDDVLITKTGARILGPNLVKQPDAVETKARA